MLFGTFRLPNLRLDLSRCQRRKSTTFRPLTVLRDEPAAPARLFIGMKWAFSVSNGLTVEALTDFLPLEVPLGMSTPCVTVP